MPVAETFDASFASHLCLLLSHFRETQIVETQVGRDAGLVVPSEQGLSFGHVCPFCEALSPNGIVLRNWVELRKIVCDNSCFHLYFDVFTI